jgi:hypothetical protein
MSLATLKKKTRTQYRNMSVGSKDGGFSLNGTTRSQGYVGQTMLGRHYPRTPMRGNVARGSGGCCGAYNEVTIVKSLGNPRINDSQVVKNSVLNYSGYIMKRYRWIRRPEPYSSVKIDSWVSNNTQGSYITNKSTKLISALAACDIVGVRKIGYNTCGSLKTRPFGSVIRYPRCWISITKTAGTSTKLGPISQTAFIAALQGSCNITEKNIVSVSRSPLPGPPASY